MSHTWRHWSMIKDLEQAYWMKKEVNNVEFKPAEADEWTCSYDVGCFIMFYGDILDQLRFGSCFTHFQANVLNSLGVCPFQQTWNAWPSSYGSRWFC